MIRLNSILESIIDWWDYSEVNMWIWGVTVFIGAICSIITLYLTLTG